MNMDENNIKVIGVEVDYRVSLSDPNSFQTTSFAVNNELCAEYNEKHVLGTISKIEIINDGNGFIAYYTNGLILKQETGIHRILTYDNTRDETSSDFRGFI